MLKAQLYKLIDSAKVLPSLFRVIAIIVMIAAPVAAYITLNYTGITLFEKESDGAEPYFFDDFTTCNGYSSAIIDGQPNDLSRWRDSGVITLWMDIADQSTIQRIDLKLIDNAGNYHVLHGTENLKIPREENLIKSDDAFPDLYFSDSQKNLKWEDFMLIDGVNLLIFQYNESLSINMENITGYEIVYSPLNNSGAKLVEDARIQGGLTMHNNPSGGKWHSPNGLPQYGVFWCENGRMKLRNVRQGQYPSNGDHTRIISSIGTPNDFVMRVHFKITDIKEDYSKLIPVWIKSSYVNPRKNTFFRIAWDFEDKWDPGHNQTIAFFSFEYNKFGMQRVYPVTRYFEQGYEPMISSGIAVDDAKLVEGKDYELDVLVRGQEAEAALYEINSLAHRKIGEVSYGFNEQRPIEELPFSFEFTGNVLGEIDLIEIYRLDRTGGNSFK